MSNTKVKENTMEIFGNLYTEELPTKMQIYAVAEVNRAYGHVRYIAYFLNSEDAEKFSKKWKDSEVVKLLIK